MSDGRKGEREKRLADALKANLKRRKERRRARSAAASSLEKKKSGRMTADADPSASQPGEPMKESG
jgi:hypothetical protein